MIIISNIISEWIRTWMSEHVIFVLKIVQVRIDVKFNCSLDI